MICCVSSFFFVFVYSFSPDNFRLLPLLFSSCTNSRPSHIPHFSRPPPSRPPFSLCRRWRFDCCTHAASGPAYLAGCSWSEYLHDMEQDLVLTLLASQTISGLTSYHRYFFVATAGIILAQTRARRGIFSYYCFATADST